MTPTEKRISNAIKNSGLSNTELAKKVNVERTSISKWIKTGRISVENLASLCLVLNIDPKYFMFENSDITFTSHVSINQLDAIIDMVTESHTLLLEELTNIKKLSR